MNSIFDESEQNIYFACWWRDDEISVNVLLSKLLRNIKSQRTVVVVDVSFRLITENTVSPIDFFELRVKN